MTKAEIENHLYECALIFGISDQTYRNQLSRLITLTALALESLDLQSKHSLPPSMGCLAIGATEKFSDDPTKAKKAITATLFEPRNSGQVTIGKPDKDILKCLEDIPVYPELPINKKLTKAYSDEILSGSLTPKTSIANAHSIAGIPKNYWRDVFSNIRLRVLELNAGEIKRVRGYGAIYREKIKEIEMPTTHFPYDLISHELTHAMGGMNIPTYGLMVRNFHALNEVVTDALHSQHLNGLSLMDVSPVPYYLRSQTFLRSRIPHAKMEILVRHYFDRSNTDGESDTANSTIQHLIDQFNNSNLLNLYEICRAYDNQGFTSNALFVPMNPLRGKSYY